MASLSREIATNLRECVLTQNVAINLQFQNWHFLFPLDLSPEGLWVIISLLVHMINNISPMVMITTLRSENQNECQPRMSSQGEYKTSAAPTPPCPASPLPGSSIAWPAPIWGMWTEARLGWACTKAALQIILHVVFPSLDVDISGNRIIHYAYVNNDLCPHFLPHPHFPLSGYPACHPFQGFLQS